MILRTALALVALGACSRGPKDLKLTVDTSVDPIVFDWKADTPIHTLAVVQAYVEGDTLGCENGDLVYTTSTDIWLVGTSDDLPGTHEPELLPPLTFGDLTVAADGWQLTPVPWTEGEKYGAVIEVWGEPEGGSAPLEATGCVLFDSPIP